MRRPRVLPLLLLLLSCTLCAAPGKDRISIAIGEWPPLISAALPHYGVVPQLITEIFAAEGITVEYQFFPRDTPLAWDGSLAGAEALRGLTIGLPLGSAKAPVLEQAQQRGWVRYEVGGDELLNLRKLLAKRFAALDLAKSSGTYLLQQRFSAAERAQIAHTASYQQWDYYLIFSKQGADNRRYRTLFDQGLRRLKASGRYAQLWGD